MDNKGLIFIPDISGYTRFVNEMEIGHSRLIIQELLETLINSNNIGLELSEIEGDAILFYKYGDSPDMKVLYEQVEKMFCEFHRLLLAYDNRRFCWCNACSSAINLTLKVITHYGEFTGLNVMNYNKLIGKDIIVAHQLLKNDIDKHEYWLVTKNIQHSTPEGFAKWMKWNTSTKQTEEREIPFYYTQLGQLKTEITPEPVPVLDLSQKAKVISVSKEFETDLITMFHLAGDFNNRSRWQEGVRKVEEINHYLPRVGMKCKCTLENGETIIYSTSYSYNDDKIEFSESHEKSKTSYYFTLEKINDNKTRVTIDLYLEKNIADQILFSLIKKKRIKDNLDRSVQNLEELVDKIKVTGEKF